MNVQLLATLEELRQHRVLALLTIDNYQWLLPQTEVHSLELLSDIDPEVRAPNAVGALPLAGEWWPVYCLSGEFNILQRIPEQRRVCVMLDNKADRLALACDQIETLNPPPPLSPVPASMASPNSPLCALTLINAELGCVTNTERLAERLAGYPNKENSNG